MVLKADMTLDAYTSDQERIKGALRATLGCDEPLCVLQVTVTLGSVILTVVAMDTSPNSQLAAAATTMVSGDVATLSTDLGIDVVERPTVLVTTAFLGRKSGCLCPEKLPKLGTVEILK